MKKIILAITGASGSIYATEFLKIMANLDVEIHGVISESGEKVLKIETGLEVKNIQGVSKWFLEKDFTSPMASGSSRYEAMAVLPCSMGTLSAIANGQSGNLIHRAGDVILKERRPLVLAVRETPFNRVHIKNMLKANDAGAIICPASPAFYHRPETIQGIAHDFACRVASLLGLDITEMKEWKGVNV